MTGIIKTYLDNKNYGFIKGDNKKDYFFHKSNVNENDLEKICEGALVSFEEKATPKGYSAIKITIQSMDDAKYIVPDKIYFSKNDYIKGWEIIDKADWIIHGTSENSPDDARNDMLYKSKLLGANAVINIQYYKTTGVSGNYHYTIHNFKGKPVNIAKKSLSGTFSYNDLVGINKNAEKLKNELSQKTKKSHIISRIFWIIILLIIAIFWLGTKDTPIFISIFLIILGTMFINSEDYDWWLEKI